MKGYEYQSDFAKKYIGMGQVEERARSLLTVLRARGLAVTGPVQERVLAEKDPARLLRWLEKAAVASSLAEIFDDPS